MGSKLSTSFNYKADKIVLKNEFSDIEEVLRKERLSTKDKLFGLVDLPLSIIASTAFLFKEVITGGETRVGEYYVDPLTSETYVSGAGMKRLMSSGSKFVLNKGYRNKINRLSEEAFEQSKDYSKDPIMKHLEPL